MFHGPNSQFQGRNAVMLRDHSTSHGMVALSVNQGQPASQHGAPGATGPPPLSPRNPDPPPGNQDLAATAETASTTTGTRYAGGTARARLLLLALVKAITGAAGDVVAGGAGVRLRSVSSDSAVLCMQTLRFLLGWAEQGAGAGGVGVKKAHPAVAQPPSSRAGTPSGNQKVTAAASCGGSAALRHAVGRACQEVLANAFSSSSIAASSAEASRVGGTPSDPLPAGGEEAAKAAVSVQGSGGTGVAAMDVEGETTESSAPSASSSSATAPTGSSDGHNMQAVLCSLLKTSLVVAGSPSGSPPAAASALQNTLLVARQWRTEDGEDPDEEEVLVPEGSAAAVTASGMARSALLAVTPPRKRGKALARGAAAPRPGRAEVLKNAAFRTPAEGLTRLSSVLRVPSLAVLASSLQLATVRAFVRADHCGGGTSGTPQNLAPAAAPRPQPRTSQALQHQTRRQRGLTEWKALLCALIADREVKSMRHDAKRLLRRLCITQASYHGVRDSYQFTAELRKVLHSLPSRAARGNGQALRNSTAISFPEQSTGGASVSAAARGKKREWWVDAPPSGAQDSATSAGGDDDELPYTTQVALHRSLTSLLRVAEVRPVNWRKYCASSPTSRFSPLEDGTATGAVPSELSAPAGSTIVAGVQQSGGGGEGEGGRGALLEEFGDLPPVCVLFALCETGRGRGDARTEGLRSAPGIGASELQPLIWQLLELTLRPEDNLAEAGAALLPHTAPGLPLRRTSAADGESGSSAIVVGGASSTNSSGKQGDGASTSTAAAAAAAAGVGTDSAGAAAETGVGALPPPPLPPRSVSVAAPRAPSPADLLIRRGLVGSDALVEMAQDLLSPAAGAEARKRTARVLHHLWTASAAGSRPEVVSRLAAYLPFAARQGSRAREWLSFLALAVVDARPSPPLLPSSAAVKPGGGAMQGKGDSGGGDGGGGGGDGVSPVVSLVRAAAAAVE
ncbi:unnamed protein product, partial [Scytosiphon promiscuus]